MIKFQDINPEVMDLPNIGYRAGENSSDAIDNIVDNIVFYIQSNQSIFGDDEANKDKDENELLSIYMDEYFDSDRGRLDYDIVNTISNKLSKKFLDAYETLSNEVASDVTLLNDQIQKELAQKTDLCEGYNDPSKLKFDYIDLSSFDNVVNLAVGLCKKYNYNVNNLTLLNIGSLYKKILEPKNVSVTQDILKSILGEITITITNNNENAEEPNVDVNTDQDIPTDITINGEEKTDDIPSDGDNDTDTPDSGTDNISETPEGVEDTSVDVNTPEGQPDNVTVTINGQKVNKALMEDQDNQDIPDPESDKDQEMKLDLYKLIIEGCFSADKFRALYRKFSNMHTSMDNRSLQLASWFSKFPISKLYNLKTSLSDTNREILESNLESMEDLQRLVAVNIDLTMRNKQDVLIVTPRMLNLPKVNDAKNKGIDIYTWVRDYLRLYHNTNERDSIYSYTRHSPISSGITLEKLIVTRPEVESNLLKYKEIVKHKEKEVYLNLLKESFSNVLNKYVDKVVKLAPDHIPYTYGSPSNFKKASVESIKSLASRLTNNDYSNIEDSVYSFYFVFWYHDTLVERIYKDTSYHLQLELHNSGTESLDTLKESNIRAKVMSSIIVSFLKELF